jgi:hypothetical protein
MSVWNIGIREAYWTNLDPVVGIFNLSWTRSGVAS